MDKEESCQASQGGLIKQQQDFQASLGVLNKQDGQLRYDTAMERIEELEIDTIIHFSLIPDYQDAVASLYPFITKTSEGTYCLDGWSFIEAARAEGKPSVTCRVEYIEGHSEEELAIRKAALRTKPQAGIASYAETVRNTKLLEQILLASDKDLRVFHHGGARKGEDFNGNRQENVARILSVRLGRSISTINQFLNHARFLNDETLNSFAAGGVKKDFFEKVNRNKAVEINRMRSDKLSDNEITNQISSHMLGWHQELEHHGEIRPAWENTETGTEEAIGTPRMELRETTPREIQKEKVFSPWVGRTTEDEIDSIDKIKRDAGDLAKRLLDAVVLEDPDLFYDRIMEETPRFCQISFRAAALRKMRG